MATDSVDVTDIAVLGAGPAGMAAARVGAAAGLSICVLDDQATPGGQIWRNVEGVAARGDLAMFGADYAAGLAAVAAFRAAGVDYRPGARVIGVEAAESGDGSLGGDVLYVRDGAARRLKARRLIIALGAYERPTPFPGWTLPGIMTAGAAQIALKLGGLAPERPFVLAGQGPLLLLLAAQFRAIACAPDVLLRLDRSPLSGQALRRLPGALATPRELAKGLRWQAGLSKGVGQTVKGVVSLSAEGQGKLEQVSWLDKSGNTGTADAATLLVHDGVIPNAQLTRAMRVPHLFDAQSAAWTPISDSLGRLDGAEWAYVVGDNAKILGWRAAEITGRAAGAAAAVDLGASTSSPGYSFAYSMAHSTMKTVQAARPFLDALYAPADAFNRPDDATLICRCEDITAGDVRQAAALGAQGPNQLKAFTRAGMGPCQGRMCAYTVGGILAEAHNRPAADIGLMRVRMPIGPVTVQELAGLNETEIHLPTA